MDILIIIGLLIAGICSAGCYIYANFYAFANMGTVPGIITLLVTIISSVYVLIRFMHSKSLDKLAL